MVIGIAKPWLEKWTVWQFECPPLLVQDAQLTRWIDWLLVALFESTAHTDVATYECKHEWYHLLLRTAKEWLCFWRGAWQWPEPKVEWQLCPSADLWSEHYWVCSVQCQLSLINTKLDSAILLVDEDHQRCPWTIRWLYYIFHQHVLKQLLGLLPAELWDSVNLLDGWVGNFRCQSYEWQTVQTLPKSSEFEAKTSANASSNENHSFCWLLPRKSPVAATMSHRTSCFSLILVLWQLEWDRPGPPSRKWVRPVLHHCNYSSIRHSRYLILGAQEANQDFPFIRANNSMGHSLLELLVSKIQVFPETLPGALITTSISLQAGNCSDLPSISFTCTTTLLLIDDLVSITTGPRSSNWRVFFAVLFMHSCCFT